MKHTYSLFLFLVCFVASLFAQDASVTAPAVDAVVTAVPSAFSWSQALIPILTPLIVIGIRLIIPKIPKVALPFIAASIGGVLSVLDHILLSAKLNVWAGLALGLAGVGIREMTKQLMAKPEDSAPKPTP